MTIPISMYLLIATYINNGLKAYDVWVWEYVWNI